MKHGAIKWISQDRGFGFITASNGEGDIFFHLSSILGAGSKVATAGQKVTYDTEKDPKGNYQLHAVNIHLQA